MLLLLGMSCKYFKADIFGSCVLKCFSGLIGKRRKGRSLRYLSKEKQQIPSSKQKMPKGIFAVKMESKI
jgi:hypothetical protein